MSNTPYIQDDFGNKIPLLDDYGNLSVEAIMLYTEDKLTAADRKVVDDFVATDEMSKDALEGYALTTNASKTRYQLGQLNSEIQKSSGAKAFSALAQPKKEFEYRKLAAAIALLVAVGGGTFFASQFFEESELADGAIKEEEAHQKIQSAKNDEPIITEVDSSIQVADNNILTDNEESVAVLDLKKKTDETRLSSTSEVDSPAANFMYDEILAQVAEEEQNVALASADQTDSEDVNDAVERPVSSGKANAETQGTKQELEQYELLAKVQDKDKFKEEMADKEAKRLSEIRVEEVSKLASAQLEEERQRTAPSTSVANQVEGYNNASRDETSARFPGGDLEMYKFIENNKQYTGEMQSQGLRGTIVISFQIAKDGKVEKAKIESGSKELLRQDALRVIQSMPDWEPAKRGNGNSTKSAKVVVIKYN